MKYVPPESGIRPMLMNAGTKLAESEAIRMSQAHAIESPAPGGRPVDGRDDGLLERADREHVRVVVLAQAAPDVAGRLLELGEVLADAEAAARRRSARPHAPTASPASSSAARARRASTVLNAFRTSGRLSVIVSTAPSRLVSTSAIRRSL